MICQTCGDDKSDTNFQKRTSGKRNIHCRKCSKETRAKRGLCKCWKPRKDDSTRCEKCLIRHKENVHRRRIQDKIAVFVKYGNKCAYCGEDREIFLTIDHVDNDGAAHRREIGNGTHVYRWLRQREKQVNFQLACYNCNCAKNAVGEDALLEVLRQVR